MILTAEDLRDTVIKLGEHAYLKQKVAANSALLGTAFMAPGAIQHGSQVRDSTYKQLMDADKEPAATKHAASSHYPGSQAQSSNYPNSPNPSGQQGGAYGTQGAKIKNPEGFLSPLLQALAGGKLDPAGFPNNGREEYAGSAVGRGLSGLATRAAEPLVDAGTHKILDMLGLIPFTERKDLGSKMLSQGAVSGAQEVGKQFGATVGEAFTSLAQKAVSGIQGMGADKARAALIQTLKMEDPIIKNIPDEKLHEAYGTMTRFAPTLSTDKNAVRSFLREAGVSGGGVSFASIRVLADAERSVNESRSPR